MTQKTFTAREIAQIKRTAQNVAPFMSKIERLNDKVSDLKIQIATHFIAPLHF